MKENWGDFVNRLKENAAKTKEKESPQKSITLKSNKDLAKMTKDERAHEYEREKEYFQGLTKDKLHLFPEGYYPTPELDKINGMRLIVPQIFENPSQIQNVVFFDLPGKKGERHETITINKAGEVIGSGALTKKFPEIDRLSILREVLDILLEKTNFSSWARVELAEEDSPIKDLVIIPPGQWKGFRGEKSTKREKVGTDTSRIEYFINHPEVLLGFPPGIKTRQRYGPSNQPLTETKATGFTDYYAFIFPRGVIFENAVRENALYGERFPQPISPELIEKLKLTFNDPLVIKRLFMETGLPELLKETKIDKIDKKREGENVLRIKHAPHDKLKSVARQREQISDYIESNLV